MIKPFYSFDRSRHNSYLDEKTFKRLIFKHGVNKFYKKNPNCGSSHKIAQLGGYKSRIDGMPSGNGTFVKINRLSTILQTKLTYLEVTKDIYFNSEKNAEIAFFNFISNIFLRYNRGHAKKYIREEIIYPFFNKTGFSFGRNGIFKFVIYNRYCKVRTDRPVLRLEFRITGKRNILKKLNIYNESEIGDAKQVFKKLYEKYIANRSLNQNKIKKLIALRKTKVEFDNVIDFQLFLYQEKKNCSSECKRYQDRIKKRHFTYYLL